jgi:hypothetical protein
VLSGGGVGEEELGAWAASESIIGVTAGSSSLSPFAMLASSAFGSLKLADCEPPASRATTKPDNQIFNRIQSLFSIRFKNENISCLACFYIFNRNKYEKLPSPSFVLAESAARPLLAALEVDAWPSFSFAFLSSAQFDKELRNKIMILKLKIVDITFPEMTQVTENRVLVRISIECQLLYLVDIEQSLKLDLRFVIPNPISSLRGFKVSHINAACSDWAHRALIICFRHVWCVCTRDTCCM